MSKNKAEKTEKQEFKMTKFKIFQIILFIYNFWSLVAMTIMGYLNTLYTKGGYQDPEVVRSSTYNFWSATINWYLNSYTLVLTYMICSAILVFGVYTYILQKIKKAKGLFLRPGKMYLAIMSAISAFTLMMLINLIF